MEKGEMNRTVSMPKQRFKMLPLAMIVFALAACTSPAPKPPGFVLSDYRALRQPYGPDPLNCAHRYVLKTDSRNIVQSAGIGYRIKAENGQILEGVTDARSETALFQAPCGTRISLYLATREASWLEPETAR